MCYNFAISKKEKIKTMLDFYKMLIFALLSALFGILGYNFINYAVLSSLHTFIIGIVVGFLIFSLVFFVKTFLKEVDKLEKEK